MNKPYKTLSTAALAAVFAASAIVPVASAATSSQQAVTTLESVIVSLNGQNVKLSLGEYADLLDAGKIQISQVTHVQTANGNNFTLEQYSDYLDIAKDVDLAAGQLEDNGTKQEVPNVKEGSIVNGEIVVTPIVETFEVIEISAINETEVKVTFPSTAGVEESNLTGKTIALKAGEEDALTATYKADSLNEDGEATFVLSEGSPLVDGTEYIVTSEDLTIAEGTTVTYSTALSVSDVTATTVETTKVTTVTANVANAEDDTTATVEFFAIDEEEVVETPALTKTAVVIEDGAIEDDVNVVSLDSGDYVVVITVEDAKSEIELTLDFVEVDAARDEVNKANTQPKLLTALANELFTDVDSTLIAKYREVLGTGFTKDTVFDIQAEINKVNDAKANATLVAELQAAPNQIVLLELLDANFGELVNADYVNDYQAAINDVTSEGPKTKEDVQKLITDINALNGATEAVAKAKASLKLADLEGALELVAELDELEIEHTLTSEIETFDFKVYALNIKDEAGLKAALDSEATDLKLVANISDISGTIKVDREVAIDGGNHTLSFTDALNDGADGERNGILLTTGSKDSSIKNLNIVMSPKAQWQGAYGIQVYNSTGVTLENVSATGSDAGLIVNGSKVVLKGTIDVSGNEFGGIEVSKGTAEGLLPSELNVEAATLVNTTEAYAKPTIWVIKEQGALVSTEELIELSTENENAVVGKEDQVQFYLKEANSINVPLANAKKAVEALTTDEGVLAEDVDQAAITAASVLVEALPAAEPTKSTLQGLVTAAQDLLDEADLDAATTAVEALTTDKGALAEDVDQATITAASVLVEALSDDEETKTDLQKAVKDAQELLDVKAINDAIEADDAAALQEIIVAYGVTDAEAYYNLSAAQRAEFVVYLVGNIDTPVTSTEAFKGAIPGQAVAYLNAIKAVNDATTSSAMVTALNGVSETFKGLPAQTKLTIADELVEIVSAEGFAYTTISQIDEAITAAQSAE